MPEALVMTIRQRFLKWVYPLLMFVNKRKQSRQIKVLISPPVSFYSLQAELTDGSQLCFEKFKGKKVLLVNTASDCGYTHQYADLQKLYTQSSGELEIIAFPANDFKQQESRSDSEIAKFCSINYGIRFPLTKKTVVVKSPEQHPVYQWLTSADKNGWNEQAPSWNFSKYLVDETGRLTHYFDPSISPVSDTIKHALHH